ncbi:hypothetical protein GCM10010359_03350 [Streptomyces morookaense]|nr:hypothetical protein GCM10010359_03350 [Streptomyces morookaense]
MRITAPGHVLEEDVQSLESWLKGEPELKGRVQVKRAARRAESGVPMGPQMDIVLQAVGWFGAATATQIVRQATESIKEWRTSRRALGDTAPPDFRAEQDGEQV